MITNIQNLKNTLELSKKEQKIITGGRAPVCRQGLEACFNPETHRWSCIPVGRDCEC